MAKRRILRGKREEKGMHVALGSDHAGFALKEKVKENLAFLDGITTSDFGTDREDISVDYPDKAREVATAVAAGEAERGILVCGTGIGMSIAANKIPGVYAAHVCCEETARLSRAHNNANILALGGRSMDHELAISAVRTWLGTSFEGGRHLKRFRKIQACEEEMGRQVSRKGAGGRLVTFEHPLIKHKIGMVRDETTPVKVFRELVQEIAGLMVYEITRDLPLESVQVKTPITETTAWSLAGKKMAVIPILRAGLGMVDGILQLIPNAKVGHIGLYRDPETLEPVEYYCKLPGDIEDRDIYIVDPMLATGGSAAAAIELVKKHGGCRIALVSLIAAPEGVEKVHSHHPEVDIFTAALDSHLNDHGYIVPGLGDAGDRLFGTK
jgi:uracil phosphoribosyltransferase